jgi:hypothetical protein
MKLHGTWSGSWQAMAASIRSRGEIGIMISPVRAFTTKGTKNTKGKNEKKKERRERAIPDEIYSQIPG